MRKSDCTSFHSFKNSDRLRHNKEKYRISFVLLRNEHLDTDLKITESAKIAHLSPCYFIRLFKNTTGQTPHQYILHQRIQKARYLLQQKNIAISEIAATVGFCDQSHFTKYFKRTFSVAPREYIARSQ
ncbi:MAG: helix-turn-helix transcriptional regulator [Cyanobacteria bacterium P01_E01_bin.35]